MFSSYVTLFFRPRIFEVRVMTALTSLLVVATLFTQVSYPIDRISITYRMIKIIFVYHFIIYLYLFVNYV